MLSALHCAPHVADAWRVLQPSHSCPSIWTRYTWCTCSRKPLARSGCAVCVTGDKVGGAQQRQVAAAAAGLPIQSAKSC